METNNIKVITIYENSSKLDEIINNMKQQNIIIEEENEIIYVPVGIDYEEYIPKKYKNYAIILY